MPEGREPGAIDVETDATTRAQRRRKRARNVAILMRLRRLIISLM